MMEDMSEKPEISTKELIDQLSEDVWPQERNFWACPDRQRYVRRLLKPDGCVFCAASQAGPGFDSLVVWESEYSLILLNKFPYNNGHLLVIPRRHHGHLLDLEQDEYRDFYQAQRLACEVIQEAYKCQGQNIGMNIGAAAGAGIPEHLHAHVLPRWGSDTNFMAVLADTKVIVETLEQTYDRLKPYFEKKR